MRRQRKPRLRSRLSRNRKLQKLCESEKELRKTYGSDGAKKAMTRLTDLRAASTLEVGAGRFDPRGVGRILPNVLVTELTPVASG